MPAQALFRGKLEEASRTVGLALTFALVLGIAATTGLELAAEPLVRAITGLRDGQGPSADVLAGAVGAPHRLSIHPAVYTQMLSLRGYSLHIPDLFGQPTICSADYMQIRALGVPAVLFTTAAGGAFRGQLDARAPFAIALGENAINLLLLSVLVFGVEGVVAPLGCVFVLGSLTPRLRVDRHASQPYCGVW